MGPGPPGLRGRREAWTPGSEVGSVGPGPPGLRREEGHGAWIPGSEGGVGGLGPLGLTGEAWGLDPRVCQVLSPSLLFLETLEKAMAPHSSALAWKIPWMEEPDRLRFMGSRRVGHD